MADYTPVFSPGTATTSTASAAITGGQLLMVTGDDTVGPAGAASLAYVGVAGHDAAVGARVTVLAGPGQVHRTTSTGAITAGSLVQCGAAGVVATLGGTPAEGQSIGVALAAAAGNVCKWKSFR